MHVSNLIYLQYFYGNKEENISKPFSDQIKISQPKADLITSKISSQLILVWLFLYLCSLCVIFLSLMLTGYRNVHNERVNDYLNSVFELLSEGKVVIFLKIYLFSEAPTKKSLIPIYADCIHFQSAYFTSDEKRCIHRPRTETAA